MLLKLVIICVILLVLLTIINTKILNNKNYKRYIILSPLWTSLEKNSI